MATEFEIPDSWGLSPQQEVVIGSLLDDAGHFVTPSDLCMSLYDEPTEAKVKMVAPAKLRVLVQRCREILSDVSDGRVTVETKRGTGWRISRKHRIILKNQLADAASA